MKLYLVRHGDAVPDSEDPKRPLSDQGRAEVKKTALYLTKNKIQVALIWHSPKERARETACIINRTFEVGDICREQDGMSPNDEIGFIADKLKVWMAEYPESSLMLVGHMPFLPRLAAYLTTGKEFPLTIHMQQAGVICLGQIDGHWVVEWVVAPDVL